MKTLHIAIIIILILCNNGVVYAQYEQEALNPHHERTLQEQLDLAKIQTEIRQQEEQQTKDISDAIILAEVGMPIAVGVSVGVLLFSRKRK